MGINVMGINVGRNKVGEELKCLSKIVWAVKMEPTLLSKMPGCEANWPPVRSANHAEGATL